MLSRPRDTQASLVFRRVALAQCVYYILTGFWPIVSIETFQWVTGRKNDLWLVKTAGALIGLVGIAIGLGAQRGHVNPEITVLGASSAASLATVDVVYFKRGTLLPIYLLDAVAELSIVVAWVYGLLTCRRGSGGILPPDD